jgi:hypothetical protein
MKQADSNFTPKSDKSDAEEVVDAWCDRLIQRPLSDEKKKALLEALGGRPEDSDSVKTMVQLIVSMPEYQLC